MIWVIYFILNATLPRYFRPFGTASWPIILNGIVPITTQLETVHTPLKIASKSN